jgi:hypothetical protein
MADKTLKVYLFSSILNMLNQNGKTNLNKGYVTQIIGPVLDINSLKEIYHLFIVQSEFR